ncbi:MAG: Crp/Fnr family transcriptional regulator [Wolinella sp.]
MQLEKIELFDALNKAQQERLMSFSRRLKFGAGNILFFEGEEPRNLYVLLRGIIKVYKSDSRGNEVILHYIQPPNLIAELALLGGVKYPASAAFESEGEVLAIDYAIFEHEFLKNGDVAFRIIKSLTRKIKALEEVITNNLTMDTTSRVARFLHDKGDELSKLSQRKIATILNTTPETLSRIIKKFRLKGMIKLEKGSIIEVDKARLEAEFDLS